MLINILFNILIIYSPLLKLLIDQPHLTIICAITIIINFPSNTCIITTLIYFPFSFIYFYLLFPPSIFSFSYTFLFSFSHSPSKYSPFHFPSISISISILIIPFFIHCYILLHFLPNSKCIKPYLITNYIRLLLFILHNIHCDRLFYSICGVVMIVMMMS